MTDQTDCRQPISPRENRVLVGLFILLSGYFIYLTVFSPAPKFYSFEEYARAQAKYKDTNDDSCLMRELKAWWVENPNGAWGSR